MERSLWREFGWIDFEKFEPAICNMFCLEEAVAQLHAADQKISAGYEGEFSP